MDCVSTEGLWSTVDFCTKPSCVRRQVVSGRSDLMKEHTPQHNLLMLGQVPHVLLVLLAFYFKGEDSVYEKAMKRIRQTQSIIGANTQSFAYPGPRQPVPYSGAQHEMSRLPYPGAPRTTYPLPYPGDRYIQQISPPCCAGCHDPITLPCWTCVDCPGESKRISVLIA